MGEIWQQKYSRPAIEASKSERWLAKYGARFLDYNPNQPRDRKGRWTRIGGFKTWLDPVETMTLAELDAEWIEASRRVGAGERDDALTQRYEELTAEFERRDRDRDEAERENRNYENRFAERLRKEYQNDPRSLEELDQEYDNQNEIYRLAEAGSSAERIAHLRMRAVREEIQVRRTLENIQTQSFTHLEGLIATNHPRLTDAALAEVERRKKAIAPIFDRIKTEGLTPELKGELLEVAGTIPDNWDDFSSDTATTISAMGYSPRDLVTPYMSENFFKTERDALVNKYTIGEVWGDAITVEINAADRTRMERKFSMEGDDLVVEHVYFKIPDHLQENGTSKETLGNAMELYEDMGVVRIDVHANITAGGYVWARYGFVPTYESWADLVDEIEDKVPFALTDDPKEIWDVADYDSKNGRLILPGTDWYGSFDMNDPDAVARYKKKAKAR